MGREEEEACARKKQEREYFVSGRADELTVTALTKCVYREKTPVGFETYKRWALSSKCFFSVFN